MLRVHDLGFPRAEAEEARVEQLGVLEHATRPNVAGIPQQARVNARRDELLVREEGDGFDTANEILPMQLEIRGPRETSGHPDDGDRFHADGLQGLRRGTHRAPALSRPK
jgi:hypothetical protein